MSGNIRYTKTFKILFPGREWMVSSVTGILFLIFYYCVQKCKKKFCMLILHVISCYLPEIFLILQVFSFRWRFSSSLYSVSCHVQIVIILSLPFQYGYFFFFFLNMSAMARTSLNRSFASGFFCLVLKSSGEVFKFSLLSSMLALGLLYCTWWLRW